MSFRHELISSSSLLNSNRITNDFLLMMAEHATNIALFGDSEMNHEVITPDEVIDELAGVRGVGAKLLTQLQVGITKQLGYINSRYLQDEIQDVELLWSDDPTLVFEAWVEYK